MNEFSYLFLFFLTASMLLNLWLNKRQIQHIMLHRHQVPDDFKDKIDLAEHQKAADYTIAKTKIDTIHHVLGGSF